MKKWLVLTLALSVSIFTFQQLVVACPADGHGCQKTEGAKQAGEEVGKQANAKPGNDHPCDSQKSGDKQANAKPGCDHPCDGNKNGDKPCPNKTLCDRKI
jgi:hypothetical protein